MRAFLAFLLLSMLTFSAAMGQSNLQQVPGFYSRQVYDLLVDKKGFLWIGHEMGISRYDGLTFTHFSYPHQASLAITDLIEDKHGRIWCHNFSAQVFYVENERLNLLKEYDFAKEDQYPRMVLNGNELVVSSANGLFVYNTDNRTSRYINTVNGRKIRTTSMALLGNKTIIYSVGSDTQPRDWYSYEPGKGLKTLKWNPEEIAKEVSLQHFSLQPSSYKDTIYVSVNPFGVLKKLMVKNDSIYAVETVKTNDFINTVTRDKETVWVNTRARSINTAGSVISDLNISDIVTGIHGNVWVGSVNQGLMVDFKKAGVAELPIEGLESNDFVRSISIGKNTILYGTQNGNLIGQDKYSKRTLYKHAIPFKTSGIEVVKNLKDDIYLFSTSNNPFIIDLTTEKIEALEAKISMKDVDVNDGALIMAAVHGLVLHRSPINDLEDWTKPYSKILSLINYHRENDKSYLLKGGRTNAVCFDPINQSILASFKDGVYEVNEKGINPLILLNERVYASSIKYSNDKILIGTVSNGLIIRKGNKVKRISVNEGLSSNNIVEMKAIGNHLWLFQTNAIQVFDINEERIITEIDLPVVIGSTMVDVAELNDTALISSTEAVYKVPLKTAANQSPIKTYLNYALINSRDTIFGNQMELPFNKNDIQFRLAAPWYSNSQSIYFKYRLLGSSDESWNISREPFIHFASLMPGTYKFESFAMHPSGGISQNTVSVEFEVLKPWWEQWWLRILVLAILAFIFYTLYRYQVNQVLKVEGIRRSISSDLHDDIGATLSSINIYTELAKREKDNAEFLNLIQENTKEIIGKLDDLVWSINPKNDSCEQLINRMRLFSEPLLSGANINYKITCSDELNNMKLSTGIKRTVYLIFKETINNIVKHSQSKNCNIEISFHNRRLHMRIADDGIGFDESHFRKNRNGLKNIQERAKQINANIKIDSVKGQGTTVQLDAVV